MVGYVGDGGVQVPELGHEVQGTQDTAVNCFAQGQGIRSGVAFIFGYVADYVGNLAPRPILQND